MIELQKLHFRYDNHREVIGGLSLCLHTGHIYGLLGCNGVGKSTLIRLICGLLRPDSGAVTIDGQDTRDRSPEVLGKLFYVPDEVALPDIPLAQFAAVTGPFYPDFSMQEFEHYSAQMNVSREARPSRMSMGERKKGYLAFALACNTPYLLLDEPTNGLDIPSKTIFRRILAGYANEHRTILLATHQVREIEELLDHILICDKQGLVLDAAVSTIAETFSFGPLADAAPAYYREEELAGDVGITPNTTGTESRPRIEMLFNAVTADRATIPSILHAKNKHHE